MKMLSWSLSTLATTFRPRPRFEHLVPLPLELLGRTFSSVERPQSVEIDVGLSLSIGILGVVGLSSRVRFAFRVFVPFLVGEDE